ncbi:DAK2 domain-containing protein [Polycladomyces subterraneus]|uniref:DAK2 domain-containing protein n=1 Tax=Polycladomyces subterraneus TaxID=1016997 RepID=A0ABT8II25_9BACL|nr:DAK2 domain-containing protein [Polycladomyces subterraneus]MDN4592437.1 DAK2 domain-containing protein [Polycladomyces subterraneus]
MIWAGAHQLDKHVEQVNALNVFPVPDGDTGTNMNLSFSSGAKEVERKKSEHVGQLAEALSKGLLMGARGNSGVILSQLFRGFAKSVANKATLTARDLALAFQKGVETAYKAVIKPVEGTILTVAREAAEKGLMRMSQTNDVVAVMEAVLEEARLSLSRTPKLLPVLAQTGVVDAGGQGLVLIYEGFLSALKGMVQREESKSLATVVEPAESLGAVAHQSAQSKIDASEIEHGYCTEFMIMLEKDAFDETVFRREMAQFGDSLLVVTDDDLVKVHIHAERPGDALNFAMQYGGLTRIKIENMREQHANIVEKVVSVSPTEPPVEKVVEPKPYGLVAVAAGDGIAEIFRSLGVDVIIEGGQTMNPSTEDIARAIERLNVKHVIILPNNKNIILTAEQVVHIVETPVTVLPTKTVPQGLAALLAFQPDADLEENRRRMTESLTRVRSGEVTYAVRDSNVQDLEIKEGDFLGIREGKIETVGGSLLATSRDLLQKMLSEPADVVTILYGKDVTDAQVKELSDFLKRNYPDVEYEVHYGGQPLYFFLFAVE